MNQMIARGIFETADSLGMDPVDLATIISYETGGTFDPAKRGPTTQWGQHRGLIQFGEPQAQQYGVNWNDPVTSQLGANGAVAKYFRASGWKPGMNMLDAYSIVNAGAPGRHNASDANNGGAPGTVRDKVERQMNGHRKNANRLFGFDGQQYASNAYAGTMTDTPPMDDDIFTPWQPDDMGAAPQQVAAPSMMDDDIFTPWQPDELPTQQAQPQADIGGFNLNPIARRNSEEAQNPTMTAPTIDAGTALVRGVGRGLTDLVAGANEVSHRARDYVPMLRLIDMIPQFKSLNDGAYQAVSDWNKADEAAYQGKYGDSGAATVGRVGGNIATAFIPGTGQMQAAKSIGQSLQAGKNLAAITKSAGLGAAQNAVIGTQNSGDSVLANAAVGAGAGLLAGSIGAGLSRSIGNTGGRKLAAAAADLQPDDLAALIRGGNTEFISGAGVTTAQAAQNPGISTLSKAIGQKTAEGGAGALINKLTQQNTARLGALSGVADTGGLTAQDAAENAGNALARQVAPDYAAAKAATSAAYAQPGLQTMEVTTTPGVASGIYDGAFTVNGQTVGGNAQLRAVVDALEGSSTLKFSDLQTLRSITSDIAHSSGISGDKNMARVAGQVKNYIDSLSYNNAAGASTSQSALFDAAKAARVAQSEQFERGWLPDMLNQGRDGMAGISGAEVARKSFGSGADQAENIRLFNRVADDASRAEMQRYAVADLLQSGADASGKLTGSASKWMDRRSSALRGLFDDPDQFGTLEMLNKDLKRSASADALARTAGSDTAQNLNVNRLLGSRYGGYSNAPIVGWALDKMAQGAEERTTRTLAALLADPDAAIAALKQQATANQYSPVIGRGSAVGGGILSGLLRDHSASEKARR